MKINEMRTKFISCPIFKHPDNMEWHIQKIFNGEYSISPFNVEKPVIIDIGANLGAFCIWAAETFPGSNIIGYEPLKANYSMLRENISNCKNIKAYNLAVGDIDKTRLFIGKNNVGENSFYQLGTQTQNFEEVKKIHPSKVPSAHILKIDTEGSEVEILKNINLHRFGLIVLEYHSEKDRRIIDGLLSDFTLFGATASYHECGIVKYIKSTILNDN